MQVSLDVYSFLINQSKHVNCDTIVWKIYSKDNLPTGFARDLIKGRFNTQVGLAIKNSIGDKVATKNFVPFEYWAEI